MYFAKDLLDSFSAELGHLYLILPFILNFASISRPADFQTAEISFLILTRKYIGDTGI